MAVTIDDKEYGTLKAAVLAAINGQTIKLGSAMTEDVEIPGGKRLTLDLNNFKLDNVQAPTIRVMKNALLNITDSSRGGSGAIDSKVLGKPAVQVDAGAECTISVAALGATGTNTFVLNNFGFTSISGKVTITGTTEKAAVSNGFDSLLKGDVVAQYNMEGYGYTARMFIGKGVTITGTPNAILNDEHGTLVITDGALSSDNETIYNWSTVNISGGKITSTSKSPIVSGSFGDSIGSVTITGGTFTAGGGSEIFSTMVIEEGVRLPSNPEVSGGTYSKTFPSDYLAHGFMFGGESGLQVVSGLWEFIDGGVGGVGLAGHRKLIVHKDKLDYVTGGFAAPMPINNATLMSVNAKGGATGYYNKVEETVVLYRGADEMPQGVVEDLTLVFLEI